MGPPLARPRPLLPTPAASNTTAIVRTPGGIATTSSAPSMNDKPYDRFVREQIAGDELWPDSADARIATGYLRLGPENNMKNEQTRLDELDDLVTTTANAFLGMTVGCARCHNHKFDPIPQKDYYRIQAVFFPTAPHEYPLVTGCRSAAFKGRAEAHRRSAGALQGRAEAARTALSRPAARRRRKRSCRTTFSSRSATPPEKRTEGQKLNANQVEKTLAVDPKELLDGAVTGRSRTAQADLREDQRTRRLNGRSRSPTAMAITRAGPRSRRRPISCIAAVPDRRAA